MMSLTFKLDLNIYYTSGSGSSFFKCVYYFWFFILSLENFINPTIDKLIITYILKYQMSLPMSNKPQVIRCNILQSQQLSSFTNSFAALIKEWFPNISNTYLSVAEILADIYYTFTTVVVSKRRLGEEYVYITMYRQQDYLYEGVTVNQNGRIGLFILQVFGRHGFWRLLGKLIKWYKERKNLKYKMKQENTNEQINVTVDGVKKNIKHLFLMMFLININPFYNLQETIMRIKHAYTYKNKDNTGSSNMDYSIQGWMLLIILLTKLIKFITMQQYSQTHQQTTIQQQKQNQASQNDDSLEKCRICYSNISNKTATICGHIFCWQCIIRILQIKSQCPVCRASCLPRQCVYLRNF